MRLGNVGRFATATMAERAHICERMLFVPRLVARGSRLHAIMTCAAG